MPTEVEEGFCEIVATVPTGLEQMAKGEVEEKFQADVETARGKIFFKTEVEHVGRVSERYLRMACGCLTNEMR